MRSDSTQDEDDGIWGVAPWRVVFSDLSEAGADRLVEFALAEGLTEAAWAESPSTSIAIGLDRATAQYLRVALSDQTGKAINSAGTALETITPAQARERLSAVSDYLDYFLERGQKEAFEEIPQDP